MTQNSVEGNIVNERVFEFDPWSIVVSKSHILQSRCTSPLVCNVIMQNQASEGGILCDFCQYENGLKLPQLPEMTFPKNILKMKHKNGFSLEFNCYDALKCVDNKNDPLKVAIAEAWKESRAENSHIKEVVKPFDWTFSTNYMGTLSKSELLQVAETDEQIDIEKLKQKPKILFYEEIVLFEDELADNGIAQCSVKIRVMPDSFFALLRYFLRVDNLCVKINDTRIYYEINNNYLLREFTSREASTSKLEVPLCTLNDPTELCHYLPVVKSINQKLQCAV